MAQEVPDAEMDKNRRIMEQQQKMLMRKVRFSEEKYMLDKWPRRQGKSFALKNLVKPLFKTRQKTAQLVSGAKFGRQIKVIRKDTQVVLVDDAPQELIDLIKKERPDVRVIGFVFEDENPEPIQLKECNLVFEK